MDREEIIQQLLLESLHQIVERGRTTWLLRVLEHGFAGYAHLSENELEAAAARLGIQLSTLRNHADESIPIDNDEDFDTGDFSLAHSQPDSRHLAYDTD